MKNIQLDGNSLTVESFRQIVDERAKVVLSKSARTKIKKTRHIIEKAVNSDELVYSINTGFGVLSKVRIQPKDLCQLQENIIRSHCAGVGENHTERESRGILLLRTNVLAKAFSGVRLELVEFLIHMLNEQIHPIIPTKGSVGASGDLIPLAHLASVILGEGEAYYQGKRIPGELALLKAGLEPFSLAPKEGLALINGTQQMTAMAALYLQEAEALVDLADLTCTCSLEGVLGSPKAYEDWVQKTRPYKGQIKSAKLMRGFMKGSEIRKSHSKCERVQDPYSFRCAPQVHGSVRDLLSFVRQTVSVELNASTDNPLVNEETGAIVSNGNFHGQPIAFAMDILGMALCEIGSLSERRVTKLIDPTFSDLPTFLVKDEGLNSGFMMAQVTAASLVSESRLLSHPGSTDSIPTNNEKEDHVSMGPLCARKAKQILYNTQYILAIELLAACQALEFRKPLKPGIGPRKVLEYIRQVVPPLDHDRYLAPDIEAVTQMIRFDELYQYLREEKVLCRKSALTEAPNSTAKDGSKKQRYAC